MRPGTSVLTLRQARYLRAWTQRELAERAGLTDVQCSRIESGQVSPRPATQRALAHRFGSMATAWRGGYVAGAYQDSRCSGYVCARHNSRRLRRWSTMGRAGMP